MATTACPLSMAQGYGSGASGLVTPQSVAHPLPEPFSGSMAHARLRPRLAPPIPEFNTMQKEDSPSHQICGICMEY